MRVSFLTAALGVAALLTTSCAADGAAAPKRADAGPRQCFYADQVNSFSAPDDRHVYVRVGVRDVYELTPMGSCPNVDWSLQIGVDSRFGPRVCTGSDVDLIVPNEGAATGPMRCKMRTVRKLTDAEVAALKNRP